MSDKIVSPEIVKLMDKITQNPTSRLFVPLAEEYLKCEMVDEAIIVLVEGIKNHPSYVAARVMLGKIYLQKSQISEAQAEFEQVIAINSDNILAHKKLAMIYQGQGQLQRALEACKKVLIIDPSDKEAKGLAGVLENSVASSAPPGEAAVLSNASALSEPNPVSGTETVSETGMEDANFLSPVESLPPVEAVLSQAPSPEVPIEESLMPVEPSAPVVEIASGVQAEPIPADPEVNVPEVFENPVVAHDERVAEAPIESPVIAEENGFAQEDSWEGDKTVVAGFEIPSSEKEPLFPSVEGASTPEKVDKKEESLLSTTLASLYMSQGHYQQAADVYEKLMARDPSDEESRQGLEKALQSLLLKQGGGGASQESSGADDPKKKKAQRLQSWLDSIRKKNES
ncbi:MAG: tetratricopeptide repeat protein [Candidatus Manganitrophus sp. SB1]|nr:tetratricopeptide repeat protein [Candidatus Manganitrophus morganii]